MKLNQSVPLRIREILQQKNMSQYKLEKLSCISHNTMNALMNGHYKSCNLYTLTLIVNALNMSLSEFFNSPYFDNTINDVE